MIEVIRDDITKLDVDAIVNAAVNDFKLARANSGTPPTCLSVLPGPQPTGSQRDVNIFSCSRMACRQKVSIRVSVICGNAPPSDSIGRTRKE